MHINELPDVVLARIFHWTCNDHDYELTLRYSIVEWRSKLALLSVCRIWRELALPSVHRTSFVRCSPIDLPKKRKNKGRYNPYDSKPLDEEYSNELDDLGDKLCVKSNLDIIGNAGNRSWPRTIQLFVKDPSDSIYALQEIVKKIRSHTIVSKKVTRMELYYEKSANSRIDEATDDVDTSSIGEELSQLIPHVHYFKCGDNNASDTFVNFSQALVKSYADQLAGFKCPQFALGKVQGFSDNLRHIDIDRRRDTQYMPQICAENLTRLSLNYVNSSFDWSSFESTDISNNLHFANLKWLRLDVDTKDNDDWETYELGYYAREFNYKVIAPKLETVILQLCPFTLSFLASIYGLATISSVELKLEETNIYFTEFDLDMARYKFASYARISQDDFQTIDRYAYMNDIFNIHSLAKNSDAKILRNYDPFDYERIDWKYLLNIEIYCPFHVNKLRNLVSKAPSLETIYINTIKIKENGKLLPEIKDESASVELLSPSLKSISFGYTIDCTVSEEDRFMVYLSKLIPRD